MSVDPGATLKEYGLDTQIQYKDGLENAYTSDTIQVKIDVNEPAGINAIITNPLYLVIVIAVIAGIMYMIVQRRKKNR